MKADLHPTTHETTITCTCGAVYPSSLVNNASSIPLAGSTSSLSVTVLPVLVVQLLKLPLLLLRLHLKPPLRPSQHPF
jgi:hypothetical protein